MIFILISIFLFIKFFELDKGSDLEDKIYCLTFGGLIGCVVGFTILALLNDIYPTVSYSKNVPIVSLRNSSNIEGNFVLGTGRIDSKNYYVIYIVLKNNSYKKYYVPDNAPINEISCGDAYMKITYSKVKNGWWKKLCFNDNTKIENYELFVPKNTIITKFEL